MPPVRREAVFPQRTVSVPPMASRLALLRSFLEAGSSLDASAFARGSQNPGSIDVRPGFPLPLGRFQIGIADVPPVGQSQGSRRFTSLIPFARFIGAHQIQNLHERILREAVPSSTSLISDSRPYFAQGFVQRPVEQARQASKTSRLNRRRRKQDLPCAAPDSR